MSLLKLISAPKYIGMSIYFGADFSHISLFAAVMAAIIGLLNVAGQADWLARNIGQPTAER